MYKQFKQFILDTTGHAWHTLSNASLWELVDEYQKITGIRVNRFWD